MIKRIFLIFILFSNILSVTNAEDVLYCKRKPMTFERSIELCNAVDDIICKDVKKAERRGCDKSDEFVISKKTSADDLYLFAKGCFKSGVTSFVQFFTDFIPDLIKEIWKLVSTVVQSPSGTWDNIKGMAESISSISSDIYEAAMEDPSAYFSEIWDKLNAAVAGSILHFDCFSPQAKVEKICSAVAEWVVPPAALAKVIVKGIKGVKEIKKISTTTDLKKILSYSATRTPIGLSKYELLKAKYIKLGYSKEEFEMMFKSGGINKIEMLHDKAKIKDTIIQKVDGYDVNELPMSEFYKGENGLDFSISDEDKKVLEEAKKKIQETKEKANAEFAKQQARERTKRLIHPIKASEMQVSDKYGTNFLEVRTKNEMGITTQMNMELVEKIVEDGKDKLIVRIYDPSTRTYFEKKITEAELKAMSPKETDKAKKIIDKFKLENNNDFK
jgi:hypothetical protein